jgi:hypothetical protein
MGRYPNCFLVMWSTGLFCCADEWQIESWFVLALSEMEFHLLWRAYDVAGYDDMR